MRATVTTTLHLNGTRTELTHQNKVSGVAILVSCSGVPVGVVIRSPLIAGEALTYPFRSHSKAYVPALIMILTFADKINNYSHRLLVSVLGCSHHIVLFVLWF